MILFQNGFLKDRKLKDRDKLLLTNGFLTQEFWNFMKVETILLI